MAAKSFKNRAGASRDTQRGSPECPTFFRMRVLEASNGGSSSYATAGYHLAIHARSLIDGDVPEDELERLDSHDVQTDVEAAWAWLERNLPRCIALVPHRRKEAFMRGVLAAADEGRF